jgi:hypothetical protein
MADQSHSLGPKVAQFTQDYYTLSVRNHNDGKGWKQIFIRPMTTVVFLGASALSISEAILRIALGVLTLPVLFSSDFKSFYAREFSFINEKSNLYCSLLKAGELFCLAFVQLAISGPLPKQTNRLPIREPRFSEDSKDSIERINAARSSVGHGALQITGAGIIPSIEVEATHSDSEGAAPPALRDLTPARAEDAPLA